MPHYFKALTPGRKALLEKLVRCGGHSYGEHFSGPECSLATRMQREGLTRWQAARGTRHSCKGQLMMITDKGRTALERGAVPVEG